MAATGSDNLILRDSIEAELGRILESPDFRHSEQSKRLLTHLVQVSLEPDAADRLRERAIGSAVFALEPGYDTSTNPIVRVRVNEIRKRLAKHYQHDLNPAIRIEIPSGGYRVDFRAAPPLAPPSLPPSARRGKYWFLGMAAATLLVAAIGLFLHFRTTSYVRSFWQPALSSPAPIVLNTGRTVVYRLSGKAQERLKGTSIDHFQSLTQETVLPENGTISTADIVPVPDQYIGIGTGIAMAQLQGFLRLQNKDSEMRFGNDVTFTELRKGPAVFIGAFNNRWTVEFVRGLRFTFETVDHRPVVRDTQSGRTWGPGDLKENGQTSEDYVLISRVLRSPSGEFMIAAAGITQYGGRTVGEVLTNESLLREMLSGASPQWPEKNIQVLMKINVIGGTAGPPIRVALHEW